MLKQYFDWSWVNINLLINIVIALNNFLHCIKNCMKYVLNFNIIYSIYLTIPSYAEIEMKLWYFKVGYDTAKKDSGY
jgi:hypothetical protein